jgi:hypothetical protein
LKYT